MANKHTTDTETYSFPSTIYWKGIISNYLSFSSNFGERKEINLSIDRRNLSFLQGLTSGNERALQTVFLTVFESLVKRFFVDRSICKIYSAQSDILLYPFIDEGSGDLKEYLLRVKGRFLEALKYSGYDRDEISLDEFADCTFSFDCPALRSPFDSFELNMLFSEDEISLCLLYDQTKIECYFANHFIKYFGYILTHLEVFFKGVQSMYNVLISEDKDLFQSVNSTEHSYPMERTVVEIFEDQVYINPNAVAIRNEGFQLTYLDFNERVNKFSWFLKKIYGINSGDIVGIDLSRSEQMVISIYGILKAEAAYLPIDPKLPQFRKDFIIGDSGAKLIVNDQILDEFNTIAHEFSSANPTEKPSANNLAYVIYTSGSTGRPKGVMLEHGGLVNRLFWMQESYNLTTEDVLIQKTNYAFDVSVWEIFWWSQFGASLYVPPNGVEKNPQELLESILKESITVIHFVPSMLAVFLDYLYMNKDMLTRLVSLKQVYVSGEALPNKIKDDFFKMLPDISLMNLYGPTEATIDVTYFDCKSNVAGSSSIPIGKPIWNTKIHILDEQLCPVPMGVIGNLYIESIGLARGYLNRQDLTEEKFLNSPNFLDRIYDSGDLARWLPDGNIEFIGRRDFQIKIRGNRIEFGEIENSILSYSGDISQAIIICKEDKGGQNLIGYYTSRGNAIEKLRLKSFLEERLPDYMVPSYLLELASFPLTSNGKIDRKALPSISEKDLLRREYDAPRNTTEETLVSIWQEVLGVDRVGITDNFFELGGHSLMVGQILNKVHKQLSSSISFRDFFEGPTIEGISRKLKGKEYRPISKTIDQENYPLTSSQRRLWVLSQLEGGTQAYNMPAAVTLKGNLNIGNLKKAFRHFIGRHEIMRTSFRTDNKKGEIRQFVEPLENIEFDIDLLDFTNNSKEEVRLYLADLNKESFDLENGSLLKVSLLRRGDEDYILFLSMHHIIGDGWSTELLISEVVGSYNSFLKGEDPANRDLPLPIQYKDYAVWLEEERENEKYKRAESYWLGQIEGNIPVLNLPSYRSRPSIQTYNGDDSKHVFSDEFTDKLKSFSKRKGVTLFMTLMAGIKSLLYRYTGQRDIIVGTPVAGREHPDLEGQIGLYLNTLAIRTRLEEGGRNSFASILEKERDALLSAYEHQCYPFDELIDKLDIRRDRSRSALFDVLVVLQNQRQLIQDNSTGDLENIRLEMFEYNRKTAQFDISYTFMEENGRLSLVIGYNTDIYDRFLIERMFLHLENLLLQAIESEQMNLEDIDFLTEAERYQLLEDFNDTVADYPKDKTIVELFEEQTVRTPDNVAVVFGEMELTYGELNERANRLGHYLRRSYDIKPDDLIAIRLDRSEQIIVAILGALKSGAAYVPIDPSYPRDRIDFIERDIASKVTIDERFLRDFHEDIEKCLAENPSLFSSPNSLVYVIYTSGTTGYPKGVMVENRNLINYLLFQTNFLQFGEERVALLASYSFDASVEQIFLPLINGSTLYIAEKAIINDRNEFRRFLDSGSITHIHGVPSLLRSLDLSGVGSLKRIISAGEKYDKEISSKYFDQYKLYNKYGPTETTVSVLIEEISSVEDTGLGRPVSNSQIYILDSNRQVVPMGTIGTLYISGDVLSRGYLNQPELTSEKFVDNPLSPGTKMYHTGDLARWLPDGKIEFLGRVDLQVKIRGHRIELGEIESNVLLYSKDLREVIAEVGEINGENVLIIYYCIDDNIGIDKLALRSFLEARLPDYMVPSYLVQLDSFPLTVTGKIDRRALPRVTEENLLRRRYEAPRNVTEETLVDIWQEVLGVEKVGITDNFFELGGHSLMVARVLNKIRQRLSSEISFRDFFEEPTIKEQVLTLNREVKPSLIKKRPNVKYYVASTTQLSIWLKEHIERRPIYNLVNAYKITGNLDIAKLESSVKSFIEDEEVLRTAFYHRDNELIAQILDSFEFNIVLHYSTNEIDKLIDEERVNPFDLTEPPLLRINLIINENISYLIITFHHIILDGQSISIFFKKLISYYYNDEKRYLASISFKDFMLWRADDPQLKIIGRQKEVLLKKFRDSDFAINLPKRKTGVEIGAKRSIYQFTEHQMTLLKRMSFNSDTTHFNILLAILHCILYKYTNQTTITTAVPLANRFQSGLEDSLGFFMNNTLVRSSFKAGMKVHELIHQMKSELLEGLNNSLCFFEDWASESNSKILSDINVMVSFQSFSNEKEYQRDDIKIEKYPTSARKHTKPLYGLIIRFLEENKRIFMEVEHDSSQFDDQFINKIIEHFNNALAQAVNDDLEIGNIDILSHHEKLELSKFNETKTFFDTEIDFVKLFERRVKETPENIAVEYYDEKLSFDELNALSNRFARFIMKKAEICQGHKICVKVEKSHQLLYILIGILKTGACYIPIDPNYPVERQEYLEKFVDAVFLIDHLTLEEFNDEKYSFGDVNLGIAISATTLFHIMFTSGSTGMPKGVMLTHRNIVNFICTNDYFPLNSETILLSTVSSSFDTTNLEFWSVLVKGGKIVIADKNDLLDYSKLESILIEKKINSLWLTASWFAQVIDHKIEIFRNLKQFISGGDVLSLKHVKMLKEKYPQVIITNGYGPTENTTFSTSYKVKGSEMESLPIGKPLRNTKVFILNNDFQLNPIGVIGTIFLSGENLAQGYYKNEKMTSERFVKYPLISDTVLYNTGDLGRWQPDGNIDFFGRKDFQVKIRGYRVDVQEIENEILKYSDNILEAVVIYKDNQHLYAYLTYLKPLDKLSLKRHLEGSLPRYMIPNFIVEVEEMPLSPNGKTDRQALVDLEQSRILLDDLSAPLTRTQHEIWEIWREVLNVDFIGIDDVFFEIGGNSLLLMDLLSKLNRKFEREIPISDLFSKATIREQEELLRVDKLQGDRKIKIKDLGLTLDQQRWIHTNLIDITSLSNKSIVNVFEIGAEIEEDKVLLFFELLVQKYEILRTEFYLYNNVYKNRIVTPSDLKIGIEKSEDDLGQIVAGLKNYNFKLSSCPLFKIVLTKGKIILCIHHLISDAWSFKVIAQEWKSFIKYGNLLSAKFVQFQEILKKDGIYLMSTRFDEDRDFWVKEFIDFEETCFPVLTKNHNSEAWVHFFLEGKHRLLIDKICMHTKKSVNIVLAAIYFRTISKILDRTETTIGFPIGSRDDFNDKSIGFFVKMLMIKVTVKNEWALLLSKVEDKFNKCNYHSRFPYDLLLNELNIPVLEDQFPISSIFFNLVDSNLGESKDISSPFHYEVIQNGFTRYDFNSYVYVYKNCIQFRSQINADKIDKNLARLVFDTMKENVENLYSSIKTNNNEKVRY